MNHTQRRKSLFTIDNFKTFLNYVENLCKENPGKFMPNGVISSELLEKRLMPQFSKQDIQLAISILSPKMEILFLQKKELVTVN